MQIERVYFCKKAFNSWLFRFQFVFYLWDFFFLLSSEFIWFESKQARSKHYKKNIIKFINANETKLCKYNGMNWIKFYPIKLIFVYDILKWMDLVWEQKTHFVWGKYFLAMQRPLINYYVRVDTVKCTPGHTSHIGSEYGVKWEMLKLFFLPIYFQFFFEFRLSTPFIHSIFYQFLFVHNNFI